MVHIIVDEYVSNCTLASPFEREWNMFTRVKYIKYSAL